MVLNVQKQVAMLGQMSSSELREKYLEVFGEPTSCRHQTRRPCNRRGIHISVHPGEGVPWHATRPPWRLGKTARPLVFPSQPTGPIQNAAA
jgi:hypothetical protein